MLQANRESYITEDLVSHAEELAVPRGLWEAVGGGEGSTDVSCVEEGGFEKSTRGESGSYVQAGSGGCLGI